MFDKIATGLARCVPWYSIDTSVMEITNHFLIEFKVYSIRYAPSLISLTRPNTHCHPGHRPYGRRSTIILLDNSDKLTPSSYLHIHRLVFQSSLEKLIFCSRWWLIQRSTTNIHAKIKRLQTCLTLNETARSTFPEGSGIIVRKRSKR